MRQRSPSRGQESERPLSMVNTTPQSRRHSAQLCGSPLSDTHAETASRHSWQGCPVLPWPCPCPWLWASQPQTPWMPPSSVPPTSRLHLLASCVVPAPSAPSLRPVTLVLRAPLLAVPSLVTSSGTQLLPQPPAPTQNQAGGLGGSSTRRDHPNPGGLAWPLALLVPLLPPPDPKASAQSSQHPPSGRQGALSGLCPMTVSEPA